MGQLLRSANSRRTARTAGSPASPPGLLETLLAPLRCVWRPASACQALFRAAPAAFWVTYCAYLLAMAVGVVLLAMWAATIREVHVASSSGAASAFQGPGAGPHADAGMEAAFEDAAIVTQTTGPGWRIQRRTLAQVWRDWHAPGRPGHAEAILLASVLTILVGTLLLTWLQLPFVHRAGSVQRSFALAWRAVAAGGGALMIGTLLSGALIVVIGRLEVFRLLDSWPAPAIGLVVSSGPLLSLWYILGVVAAAADRAPAGAPPPPPPRCELCGYDLTRRGLDEVCPECGQSVARSLVAGMRRSQSDWERHPSVGTWLRSSVAVLCSPGDFYERLTVRSPGPAETEPDPAPSDRVHDPASATASLAFGVSNPGTGSRPSCGTTSKPVPLDDGRAQARGFSRLHLMAIGVGAFFWVIGVSSLGSSSLFFFSERVPIALVVALVIPLIGWALHRTIAAVVATWWMVRGSLPDGRWAAKLILYETPFLWLFCAVWGTLITSYIAADEWVSRAIEPVVDPRNFTWAFGMPPELALPMGLSGALVVLWLFRYQQAGQAVRWSNF